MTVNPASQTRTSSAVYALVGVVAAAAGACLVVSFAQGWERVSEKPASFAGFLAITVALQLMAVRIRDRGAISVAGIAFLATGFTFGVAAAIVTALAAAGAHAVRSRPLLHRAVFNAGAFSLAAAGGSGLYHLLETADRTTAEEIGIAFVSGGVFALVNVGLLSLAMSISEGRSIIAVWSERLRWLTPHYLGFGVLALASTLVYEDFGHVALVALALPPALLVLRAALPRRASAAV
jgi:hypothetical protein